MQLYSVIVNFQIEAYQSNMTDGSYVCHWAKQNIPPFLADIVTVFQQPFLGRSMW